MFSFLEDTCVFNIFGLKATELAIVKIAPVFASLTIA